ncbi:MAG: hypothetical protein EKK63_02470 [Acinetobacter sp.]|uniref:hypothetical protein n=1 Tax=Acinetobacter sp. TaxID=472 RepID=UPI000F9C98FA|nr:hypothetical protein [Acinetobacter sp.]RUP42181.1 MAG: hypothetical protein EKK63_02470 [Acinetobacter sp.]
MTEQLISFETAKLAKEKGFAEPCKGFAEPFHQDVLEFVDDGVLYVYESYQPLKDYHEVLDDDFLLAPTQSFLQKWLREKHQLMCFVDFPTDWSYFTGTVIKKGSSDMLVRKIEFSTYEEALEAALFEALKLLT